MKLFKTVPLEHAITVLRWASVFKMLMFILPVIVIIYQYKGLSTGDFFLIQGLFAIAVFILEIPTGYIGDLFSRKKVITLAFFMYLLGYVVLFSFNGFLCVLIAEVLFGLCIALYSGTADAYVYDVLKKQNREKDFLKELGKFRSYGSLGTTIATFAGGIIYQNFGPDATIFVELVAVIIAFSLTLFLPELNDFKRVVEDGKSKVQDIIDIVKFAINHSEIKWLMLFPATFGSATMIILWVQQPIMKDNLIPIAFFGFFVGMNQLFRALFSMFTPKIFRKLKTKHFVLCLFGVLVSGLLSAIILPSISSLYINYVLLLILSFVAASHAGLSIVISSMINHRIKSDERATVLSVRSMFSKLMGAIVMISLKFLIDGLGIQGMLLIISPIIIILIFISMKKLLKLKL
ncbi:MAG: MFS transporter [Proteobacteria bacterium]|nr:MFS transporter [Pseudomonadota bacterium]